MEKKQMRCLIVGANSSIAPEIIKIFKKNNYDVISASRKISDNDTKTLSYSLNTDGDLKITDSVILEKLDVVVFCIGKLIGKSIQDYTITEMEETFGVNILTVSKFIKYLISKLNSNSSVVFISSISASAGSYDEIYSASKSALYGLTKSLAKNSKNGIRYNCISPGLIKNSRMYDNFDNNEIQAHISQTPTKNLINSKEFAEIIYDICQPHWRSLNGQIIDINGGRYV